MNIDNNPLVLKDLVLYVTTDPNEYKSYQMDCLNGPSHKQNKMIMLIERAEKLTLSTVQKVWYQSSNTHYKTRLKASYFTLKEQTSFYVVELEKRNTDSGAHDLDLEQKITDLFDTVLQEGRPVARYRSILNFEFCGIIQLDNSQPKSFINEEFRYLINDFDTRDKNGINASLGSSEQSPANSASKATIEMHGRKEQLYRYFHPRFRKSIFTTKQELGSSQNKADNQRIREYRYPIYGPIKANPELAQQSQSYIFSVFSPDLANSEASLSNPLKLVESTFNKNEHEACINAEITSLRLLSLYENQLLSIEVKPAIEDDAYHVLPELLSSPYYPKADKYLGWWRVLLNAFSSNGLKAKQYLFELQTCRWLAFNNLARNLYPSYIEQTEENKIFWTALYLRNHIDENTSIFQPKILVDNTCSNRDQSDWEVLITNTNRSQKTQFPNFEIVVSPIITELASKFFIEPDKAKDNINNYEPLDPRMYVLSNIGLSGDYPTSKGGSLTAENTFDLAKYIDRFDSRVAQFETMYNAEFMQELSNNQDYLRWKNITNVSSFNEFSSVNLSYGWFANNVLYWHWTEMYAYLCNYCLLIKAILYKKSDEIQDNTKILLTESDTSIPGENFRDLRRNFIEFKNRFWFTSVSAEQQPTEIFAKLKTAIGIQHAFDEVQEKIAWADEFIESRREQRFLSKSEKVATAALAIAIITFIFGIKLDFAVLFDGTLACMSGENKCVISPMLAPALINTIAVLLITFIIWLLAKPLAKFCTWARSYIQKLKRTH